MSCNPCGEEWCKYCSDAAEYDELNKELAEKNRQIGVMKEALAKIKWQRPVLLERVHVIATEALEAIKDKA